MISCWVQIPSHPLQATFLRVLLYTKRISLVLYRFAECIHPRKGLTP
jgi:hypothetical protein